MKLLRPHEKHQQQAKEFIQQLASNIKQHPNNIPLDLAVYLNNCTEKYLAQFITCDAAMDELKNTVRKLAPLDDPVLITGPSGTGKELIARALHGLRPSDSFYPLNCAGMPEDLIESELFGHEAGAFTGARGSYEGILRAAKGGTVFLDEIGEAPLHLQAKLLRALQPDADGYYYIRPVGSSRHCQIDCRIIAASKTNLLDAVRNKSFREDLYGRLMAFELETTPLSSRPCDKLLILSSLNCSDLSDLDSPEWTEKINLFNVRALQAYAKERRWKYDYAHPTK